MADYISPDGHNDPNGTWSHETRAYDGNTTTYAHGQSRSDNVWSNFLELTRSTPIYGDKVKIVVKLPVLSGVVISIDVDVYYDGGWRNVWEGDVTGSKGSYQTKILSLAGGNHYVSKIRFRGKARGVGGATVVSYAATLYEAYFYGSPYLNIGLRYYDGSNTRAILCKVLESSDKFRISKAGVEYGIPLVSASDPTAGNIRVYDGSAIYSFPTEVV
jgi:hypothetical protein